MICAWGLMLPLYGAGWLEPCNYNKQERATTVVWEVVPRQSSDGLVSMCIRIWRLRLMRIVRRSLIMEKGSFYTCWPLHMILIVSFVPSEFKGRGGILLVDQDTCSVKMHWTFGDVTKPLAQAVSLWWRFNIRSSHLNLLYQEQIFFLLFPFSTASDFSLLTISSFLFLL